MATQPYDEIGAMGGLFAPAFIFGDPISEAAVARWNAAHLQRPPAPDVYKPPTDPKQAQRDAIAAMLMSGSPSYFPDAGGLGAGGGPYGSDPGAGGTTTPGAAPDTSAAPATPVSVPADDQSGGRPSLTDMEKGGVFEPGVTTATPNKGAASDQAVLDAQLDAARANADLAAGREGSRSGAPNLGYEVGPNYGYGVNPTQTSRESDAQMAARGQAELEASEKAAFDAAPSAPASPTAPTPPGQTPGEAMVAAKGGFNIDAAVNSATSFGPNIATPGFETLGGRVDTATPQAAPAVSTAPTAGQPNFGDYATFGSLSPAPDEPSGSTLGGQFGDIVGGANPLGLSSTDVASQFGTDFGGWGSSTNTGDYGGYGETGFGPVGNEAATAVAEGTAPSDIGGLSTAGGGGYSPQSAANEAAATEAANAAGDVSMGLGPDAFGGDGRGW